MCCEKWQVDPFRAPVKYVLQFLTDLYQQGLGYSAINTARSALSAVMQTTDNRTIGAHPTVIRFLKGVFELRTPQPRYKQTWDVGILLDFFKRQAINCELSLKDLTRKLCALLLLASAQRVQTIHLIRRKCIHFHDRGCSIQILDKLKHTRPGNYHCVLEFSSFTENEKLCVVACLKEYLERTAAISVHEDKLFLCYSKPHNAASKDTVARWLRNLLEEAGIDNFKPHSFRGAAATAMLNSGMTLEDLMKKAGWTQARTFQRFYHKSVQRHRDQGGQSTQNTMLNYIKKQ